MNEPAVYDKASWHYDGDYPADLAQEQAFVHSGMFLGWIIDHDLNSDWFKEELESYISAFKKREMTGPKVFEACDGVLMADMLSDEGNAFAEYYFDFKNSAYLRDYSKVLGVGLPTLYHVRDSWENYEKLTVTIDRRYWQWKKSAEPGFWRRLLRLSLAIP